MGPWKPLLAAVLWASLLLAAPALRPEPADEDLVEVLDYIPTILAELKYATEDNFTGQVLYEKDARRRMERAAQAAWPLRVGEVERILTTAGLL